MMVDGPGHVPLDKSRPTSMEKRMSGNAPITLGPLPIDTGAGYDHITAAVGLGQSAATALT
jgi:phosphomethylpyrimidine synthase